MRFLLFFLVVVTGWGIDVNSMIDKSYSPQFSACEEIAKIKEIKPRIDPQYRLNPLVPTPEYPHVHEVYGPVQVDVAKGEATYRVYDSRAGEVSTITVQNPTCNEVDPVELNKIKNEIEIKMQSEVSKAYSMIDKVADDAIKNQSDKTTTSQDIASAVTLSPNAKSSLNNELFEFWSRGNGVYSNAQTLIFFGVIMVTLLGMGGKYITTQIQGQQHGEDYISRFAVGISLVFLLYSNHATYKYGDGEISITKMQAIWSWMVGKGTVWANELAGASHQATAKSALKDRGGEETKSSLEQNMISLAQLQNKEGAYVATLNQCVDTFREDWLIGYMSESSQGGVRKIFPTKPLSGGNADPSYQLLKPDLQTPQPLYIDLYSCGRAEDEYKALVAQKKDLLTAIQNDKSSRFSQTYVLAQKDTFETTQSNGWVSIAMLPIHHFVSRLSKSQVTNTAILVKDGEKKEVAINPDSLNMMEKVAYWVENVYDALMPKFLVDTKEAIKNTNLNTFMQSVTQRAVLVGLVPGMSDVESKLASIMPLSGIPVVGGFLSHIVAFYMASDIAMIVIENLPFLVLIPAISIVIALYFAEVMLFTIVLPFVSAYAFSKDQWGKLVEIGVKAILLALKPAMIVIAVHVSIYTSKVVTNVSNDLIVKQQAVLSQNSSSSQASSGLYDIATGLLGGVGLKATNNTQKAVVAVANANAHTQKGVGIEGKKLMGFLTAMIVTAILNIFMAVISVFIVIKIIFSGPQMIMEMFGVRGVDMASNMAESIKGSMSKYEKMV